MADLRALALTQEQAGAVRAVLDKHRTAAMARHRAAGRKEDALRTAALDPATPEARLRALHAEAAEARLQELLAQRALAQELNALLTPEQQAKAARIRVVRQKEREAHQALMDELGDPSPLPPPPPMPAQS
jgi:Spy/CpxP family protein refolding chaperone